MNIRQRPCADCCAIRAKALGAKAGLCSQMLAAPFCDCQCLDRVEARARLTTPGLGALTEVSVAHVRAAGLWVSVAKGADVRALGAVADIALGLGVGDSLQESRARAVGEALERYGAALVPPGTPAIVSLTDGQGHEAGRVPASRIWLPYHRYGQPQLPSSSTGLAFGWNRLEAARAAMHEVIERFALDRLLAKGFKVASALGTLAYSPWPAQAFQLLAPRPVAVVVIGERALLGAGMACALNLKQAIKKAWQEAVLDRLITQGDVLPGLAHKSASILGPLAGSVLADWPQQAVALPSSSMPTVGWYDLTPPDISAAGGYVLRALVREEHKL